MTDHNSDTEDNGKLLYCSFCGKSQHEVRKSLLLGRPYLFAMSALTCVTTLFAKRCMKIPARPAAIVCQPQGNFVHP